MEKLMDLTFSAVIESFAAALDGDDYDTATALLDSDCIYEMDGKKLHGREAIIKSFRDSSEWGHANLEKLVFVHSIERCQNHKGIIRFVDFLEHSGKHLRHECLMHVTGTSDGLVKELRLENLPGEKEKVSKFFESIGISRSQSE
jgi:hypothetical protein